MNCWMILLGCPVRAATIQGKQTVLGTIVDMDPAAGWWRLRFFNGTEYEINHPWNGENDAPGTHLFPGRGLEGSRLMIEPKSRTFSNCFPIRVACHVPAADYGVDQVDLNVDGCCVNLDLYWARSKQGFPAYVWRTYTASREAFEAGTYVLEINRNGAATGTATKVFTVHSSSARSLDWHWLDPDMPLGVVAN